MSRIYTLIVLTKIKSNNILLNNLDMPPKLDSLRKLYSQKISFVLPINLILLKIQAKYIILINHKIH